MRWLATERRLTDQLEALGLRRLGPEPVGPAHRHRSLRAGPPGFVDVVGRPHDQGCDFRRVRECDEGLTAHKTRRLTLCITIAIQQLSRLVNLVNLGPVMRENTDHAGLLRACKGDHSIRALNGMRFWHTRPEDLDLFLLTLRSAAGTASRVG